MPVGGLCLNNGVGKIQYVKSVKTRLLKPMKRLTMIILMADIALGILRDYALSVYIGQPGYG
jgi:hypothetical protein